MLEIVLVRLQAKCLKFKALLQETAFEQANSRIALLK
jgi:hypothetical protein